MWYRKNKIRLSPKLKLGVGRGRYSRQLLKFGGMCCLLLAVALGIHALKLAISKPAPEGKVLGESTQPPIVNPQEQWENYTVQKGDTLFSISQQFNIPWSTLAEINHLTPPFTLKTGQTLKVPSKQ